MENQGFRVIGFDTKAGKVETHRLIAHTPTWMKNDSIHKVIFETFNSDVQISTEIMVHWTKFTEWTKKNWPAGGRVCGIVTKRGTILRAEARYANHNEESYLAAPMICRDAIRVVVSDFTVLEVAGVREWLRSKRDEEATNKLLNTEA